MKKDLLRPDVCAELLHALAAPERLRIVRSLLDGPKNVTAIAAMLKIALVNVSHHLTVLRQAGLVRNKKQGRFVLYSLTPGVLQAEGEGGGAQYINLGCCRLELPTPPAEPGQDPS